MAEKRGRLQSIDVYRGIAIVAMAAYHFSWDLNYYGLIQTGIGVDPVWISAQRTILTAFLLLAGAALAVSVGTWILFQDYFAYFGVLHMIALGSLLALPFVRLPIWAGILTAVVALALPALYSSDIFDPRWLAWIGFFHTTAETADLVPVFPWLGVMLIGVLGMRLLRGSPAFTWRSSNIVARGLGAMGRWSLIIYLVHQPLLFGIVTPIANYLQTAEQAKLESFSQSCLASCGQKQGKAEGAGGLEFCTAYCRCALDMTVKDNLWSAPADEVARVSSLCTAMSE